MSRKIFLADIIRWTIYFLEIVFFYVLERNFRLVPEAFGARPLILAPTFISISIFEKEYVSMTFGIIIGTFLDVSMGGLVGLQMVFLFLLGYVLGVLFTYFISINFLTFFAASLLVVPAVFAYRFLIFYIIPGFGNINYAFMYHVLPSAVYTFAVAPVIYLVNKSIAYYVRRRKVCD